MLRTARTRLDARIAELQRTRARIDEFEATHHTELVGHAHANGWALRRVRVTSPSVRSP